MAAVRLLQFTVLMAAGLSNSCSLASNSPSVWTLGRSNHSKELQNRSVPVIESIESIEVLKRSFCSGPFCHEGGHGKSSGYSYFRRVQSMSDVAFLLIVTAVVMALKGGWTKISLKELETEVVDVRPTSLSDQAADMSSDESEADDMDLMPNSDQSDIESEPSVFTDSSVRHGRMTRSRMHPGSKTRMRQVRKSVKAVITELDAWSASKATHQANEFPQQHMGSAADLTSQIPENLQEALSKLSSKDVAFMKAFLDAKLACIA